MVGLPRVEHRVECCLVIKIAIPAIDRQFGRGNGHQERAWTTSHHFVALARSNHDHLVAKARSSAQLRLHIGANSAAGGRIKSADVGDTHWWQETVAKEKVQVKLC